MREGIYVYISLIPFIAQQTLNIVKELYVIKEKKKDKILMHYLLPYDTVHSTLFPSFTVMCQEICNQVDKTTKVPKKNARVSRTICILATVKETSL